LLDYLYIFPFLSLLGCRGCTSNHSYTTTHNTKSFYSRLSTSSWIFWGISNRALQNW